MYYLLLVITTLVSTGKILLCKKIGVTTSSPKNICLMNSAVLFIAFLLSVGVVIISGNEFKISPFSLTLAVIFAFSILLSQLFEIKAMSMGNTAVTTLVYSCGFLIPVFAGALFWNEPISFFQIIGIVILLFALFLIVNPREFKPASFMWYIYSLIALFFSGLSAIIQKTHQKSQFAEELPSFLVCAFLISSVIAIILYFVLPKTQEKLPSAKVFIRISAISGIFAGALNFLNLILAGKIPAVIQFPIYNIGSVVLTGILGSLIFRENNSRQQKIGFAIGLVAILIIGLL